MSVREFNKWANEKTKQEQKEMFLQLRIQGCTFDEISKKLGRCKQTLINWSKEPAIKEAIDVGKAIKLPLRISRSFNQKDDTLAGHDSHHTMTPRACCACPAYKTDTNICF
jgi:hypothetical protein